IALAVPPVETSSTPRAASVRAASTRPVLSETEIRARFSGARSEVAGKSGAAGTAVSWLMRKMPRRAARLWFRAPRWSPHLRVSPVTRNGPGLGRRLRRVNLSRLLGDLGAIMRCGGQLPAHARALVEPRLTAQHDLLAVADLAILVTGRGRERHL